MNNSRRSKQGPQTKSVKQDIHGVILLDKPTGMSSNYALQKIKHCFNAKKAGHTGSLDPLATGLLPICLGQATKVSEYLLHSHKKYTTVLKLGEVTDTLDSEGEITVSKLVEVSDEQLEEALGQFRGNIQQVPPMYSALKKDGQPLYKLARKGESVDRPARDMMVHSLEAKRLDAIHVELKVHCSSGFYIRSLCHDLGQALGCGAHVVELRRTDIKAIHVSVAYSLEEILKSKLSDLLLPLDVLIEHMPKIEISDAQASSMIQGKPTLANGLTTTELTRFYQPNGYLYGVGQVNEAGLIKAQKTFVDTDK
jgi:tRNA pseudouridine55 synthase